MFTTEELEKIGALCREFDAWVFTDEIYEYIVYDGRKHVSIASIPSCRDITITISGFSKTFSITGWRIGYAIADARVAGPIGLMNDLFAICAPTPLQWGVARALEIGDEYYRNLAADYQKKRDILAAALEEAGFRPSIPQGSYYMLAQIPDEFRAPIILVDMGDFSYDEAAEILSCPIGTIRSRLSRGGRCRMFQK